MGDLSVPLEKFRKMWQRNVAFVVTDHDIVNSALVLKEDDLRFIDIDSTRHALDNFQPPPSVIMNDMRIENALGIRPTYR